MPPPIPAWRDVGAAHDAVALAGDSPRIERDTFVLPPEAARPPEPVAVSLGAAVEVVAPSPPPVKPAKSPSGSGSELAKRLPELPGIRWEWKRDGGVEVWHAPSGAMARADKTYLGRVGKQLQQTWLALEPAQCAAVITEWVAAKRAEKGVHDG